jgi:lysozyme
MSRAALAAAVRWFAPGGKLQQSHIPALNALADALGLPANDGGIMRTSPEGIALIHSFESLKLDAYKDPGPSGLPITIGWGSTRDETGGPIKLGDRWSKERADARFAADLDKFERGVIETLNGSHVSQSQFDALVSFAYNLGLGNLGGSTLLKKHRAGDYVGAANEFQKWNRAGGKVLNGLTRRRAAEAALYRIGS